MPGKKLTSKKSVAGKAPRSQPSKKVKRHGKKRSYASYSSYIYKVLKQVHPDTAVSTKAMAIMNGVVNDMLERLVTESSRLTKQNKAQTVGAREIQTAVRLVFPGELHKHGVSEGTKAVTKYNATQTEGKTEGQKKKKQHNSRSARAGLQFPVGRVQRQMKSYNVKRVGAGAPVYLAAVLEYIAAEILELAGNAARDNKKQRIVPRHITLAVRNDEELNKLLSDTTIASGGVLPNIHTALLPKKSKKGE